MDMKLNPCRRIVLTAPLIKKDEHHYEVNFIFTQIKYTHFDEYNNDNCPWLIWEKALRQTIKDDLVRINSNLYQQQDISFTCDETFYFQNIHNKMFGSLIVSIYSTIEDYVKTLLKLDKYKYKCFCCKLKSFNINIKNLPHFNEINLLRLYANCFKHNDCLVNKEIMKQEKLNEVQRIDYTKIDIKRTIKECYEFLDALEKAINISKKSK